MTEPGHDHREPNITAGTSPIAGADPVTVTRSDEELLVDRTWTVHIDHVGTPLDVAASLAGDHIDLQAKAPVPAARQY